MGWFKKITKSVKKAVKKVGDVTMDITGANLAKDFADGVTGKTAAKAQARAEKEAIEQARRARVAAAQGAQFASDDVIEEGMGNVVLGTQQVDESLEEQLKRLRAGAR